MQLFAAWNLRDFYHSKWRKETFLMRIAPKLVLNLHFRAIPSAYSAQRKGGKDGWYRVLEKLKAGSRLLYTTGVRGELIQTKRHPYRKDNQEKSASIESLPNQTTACNYPPP